MESAVQGATKEGNNWKVEVKDNKTGAISQVCVLMFFVLPLQITGDVVLVSIGRRPYTEGLGLENIGLKTNKRGQVETDPHRRTNVPGVWAIGDVITGKVLLCSNLTPKALCLRTKPKRRVLPSLRTLPLLDLAT